MRKIIFFTLFLSVFSFANASLEDNSIIEALEEDAKVLKTDFDLKSFNSCQDMEDVMSSYIKEYWKNNKWSFYPRYWFWGWVMVDDMVMMDSVSNQESAVSSSKSSNESFSNTDDFSETNTQVKWVDESDIVKTDGKNIYYYNSKDKYVYVVWVDEKEVLKKIKVPSSFTNPVLYLWDNTLTILSSWYHESSLKTWYWLNRNNKTFVITFDISDVKNPVMQKLYIADWYMTKSRKIGDYVYVLSTNNFNIPYYTFETLDDIDFDLSKAMPKKIDLSKADDKKDYNLKLNWKTYPYNIKAWNVSDCNDIEYVLPDEETLKEYDFSPSYNVISVIDTKNPNREVKTNVVVWSNNEIYMSTDNLYMTSNMYKSNRFVCPVWARCFAPWYPRGNNTVIHKLNISWDKLSYQDSTMIPWAPLTQYSMDEYEWNFRILTKISSWSNQDWESYTDLYILDENLDLEWSLTKLWLWEEFKSSRYIWDKLYLVTFEQIDPLFVIDVANPSEPEVLGELKIPWYSTYLHPYDDNHLIGLGYDTDQNDWGWTVNSWVKLDLYQVNYDKKCWDEWLTQDEIKKCDSWDYKWIIVKQKFTKTFGDRRSYSEALNNPRMFMWNDSKQKLFLPVTLYKNSPDDMYRSIDYFNGLLTVNIDKDSWIKEEYRISHIDTTWLEEERQKECSKYTWNTEEKCHTLLDWTEYCEPKSTRYVPKYCYKDSTIGEYIASKSWNFRDSYINRALWIGDNSYAISNEEISSHKISDWSVNYSVELK